MESEDPVISASMVHDRILHSFYTFCRNLDYSGPAAWILSLRGAFIRKKLLHCGLVPNLVDKRITKLSLALGQNWDNFKKSKILGKILKFRIKGGPCSGKNQDKC